MKTKPGPGHDTKIDYLPSVTLSHDSGVHTGAMEHSLFVIMLLLSNALIQDFHAQNRELKHKPHKALEGISTFKITSICSDQVDGNLNSPDSLRWAGSPSSQVS